MAQTSPETQPSKPATTTTPKPPPSTPTLRRHDSCTNLDLISQTTPTLLRPQSLRVSFPCSRPKAGPPLPPTYKPTCAETGAPQAQHQDRLQTALDLLARAAAHTHQQAMPRPDHDRLVETLYRFASPNWSLETWEAAVKRCVARLKVARGGGAPSSVSEDAKATKAAEVLGEGGRAGSPPGTADEWVARAVEVLKREGEEGPYWRDGRDLAVMWERAAGSWKGSVGL